MIQIMSGKILPGDVMRLFDTRFYDVPIVLWVGKMAEDLVRYSQCEIIGIFREEKR